MNLSPIQLTDLWKKTDRGVQGLQGGGWEEGRRWRRVLALYAADPGSSCASHKVPRASPGVIPEHRALSTGPASQDPDPAFPSPQSQPVSGASPYLVWEADPCRGSRILVVIVLFFILDPFPRKARTSQSLPAEPSYRVLPREGCWGPVPPACTSWGPAPRTSIQYV